MKSRASFPNGRHLVFQKQVIVDDFESRMVAFYNSTADVSQPILIDFQGTTYIDIPVLSNLIALCVARQDRKAETFLGISKSRAVRDMFRVWRFPEAFSDATGIIFENILVQEDLQYRGEPQITYSGAGGGIDSLEYNPDWREGYPGRRNFFEFNTYRLGGAHARPTSPGAIPRIEGTHWNGQLIQEVLKNHLPGETPKDDIARVVIYETLSNAVRHPNARIVQAVSRFEKNIEKLSKERVDKSSPSANVTSNSQVLPNESSPSTKMGYLRICVWDDGESIVDTLKPLIEKGFPIRSMKLPSYMYDKIHVQTRKYGDRFSDSVIIDQETDPDRNSPDSIILLASFHPGISRTVSIEVKDVEPLTHSEERTDARTTMFERKAGMGLYALMRTALDVYRGTIIARSGNLLILLEPAHDAYRVKYATRYKAKITELPKSYFGFRGNLLIVQLPVRQ